jgi:general stress protein YciG
MPNNNPQGHNQYTRSEDRSTKSRPPAAPVPPATEAAGGATDLAAGAPATSGTSRRGFASMDERTQREIASKGGHSQGRDNNPGNFANDRDKAREAGRKGGEAHGSHVRLPARDPTMP